MMEPGGAAHYSLSRDGTLVYVPGGVLVPDRRLVWVDRNGDAEALPAAARTAEMAELDGSDSDTDAGAHNVATWAELAWGTLDAAARHLGQTTMLSVGGVG